MEEIEKKENNVNSVDDNVVKVSEIDEELKRTIENEINLGKSFSPPKAEDNHYIEIDKLRKQNAELESQNEILKIELVKRIAEFENHKKRTVKEKSQSRVTLICELFGEVLKVLDNITRAIKSCEENLKETKFFLGLVSIEKQFNAILSTIGIEELNAVGQEFDPNLHEAISHVEDEKYGKNIIVEEVTKGYVFGGKLVRHSMVVVAN